VGNENVEIGVSRAICCGGQRCTRLGVRCSERAGFSPVGT